LVVVLFVVVAKMVTKADRCNFVTEAWQRRQRWRRPTDATNNKNESKICFLLLLFLLIVALVLLVALVETTNQMRDDAIAFPFQAQNTKTKRAA
jgi:uncharacterized BrkB/YihY/UPF0761 family membrane protein